MRELHGLSPADISSFYRCVPPNVSEVRPQMQTSTKPQVLSFDQSPPLQPAIFDSDADIQQLDDYCADLKAQMGSNGIDCVGNMMDSTNFPLNPHKDITNGSSSSSSEDGLLSYRQGQPESFRNFPRFEPGSRPIVSENWRAPTTSLNTYTPAPDAARPRFTSLMTASPSLNGNTLTPVTIPSMAPSHPRTPFFCTPTRSPLTAPANPSITGFAQLSPNPPPTPVSLSTPISLPFSGGGYGRGHGHVHHLSASSLSASSINNYSPMSAPNRNINVNATLSPASASPDLIASQLNTLSLRGGHMSLQHNNSTYGGNGAGYSVADYGDNNTSATFFVTLSADTLGYCFIRPNGTRTRLVPVDMLPYQLQGVPAQESGNERLVALPVPGGVGVDGRSSNVQLLKAVSPVGGNIGSGDAIQSQIDHILQTNPHLTPSQHATATNKHTTTTTTAPKRMKIYCDKWVHEGVCAFTQQGCKYKHEMPVDKATQHQLGLFLGYPMWWKRRQAELMRVQPQASQGTAEKKEVGEKRSLGGLVAVASAADGGSGFGHGRVDGGADGGGDGIVSRRDAAVNADVNGGLAASRWSAGLANGNGTGAFANKEKLLRPSWRAPDEGVSHRRYAEQSLQGYDGAGAGAEHHSSPAVPNHSPIFTPTNNTHPLAWPWEDHSYSSRHSSPTTIQQHQLQSTMDTTTPFNAPCPFTFPSSPYGPIAPPTPMKGENNTRQTGTSATNTTSG